MLRKLSIILIIVMLVLPLLPTQIAFAASCSATDLVLSEISYDDGVGTSTDEDEFFEIYLPNAVAAGDFDNCVIQHLNQNQTSQYTIDLSPLDDSGIAAGTYLLFGSTNVAGRDATLNGSCATNCLQNGADDGIALLDTSQPAGSQGVWFYTWEDGDSSEPAYEGVSPIDIGTDTGAACGNGDEDGLSQPSNPPTAANAAAGNFTAGSCTSPGASNLTPTAVSLNTFTATSGNSIPLIFLSLITLIGLSAFIILGRRHPSSVNN